MNRGHFEGFQKINGGPYLRRGRMPKAHDISVHPHSAFVIGSFSTGGASASNLNNAYSFGVSGTVTALRYMPHFSAYLNEFWYYTGTRNGTPTGALTIEVREANASSITLPGTLMTSESHTPTADNTWQRVVFTTPPYFSINKIYYIIIGDAAGNATNFYRVHTSNFGLPGNYGGSTERRYGTVTTSNGFATSGSGQFSGHVGLMRFSNGLVIGNVHTTGGTSGNNTNKRGYLIENLEADYEIFGVQISNSGNISGIEVFDKSQSPNQTPMMRQATNTDTANLGICYFEKPFRMRAGKSYRVVLTYSAASSNPGQINATFAPGNPPTEGVGLWGDRMFPCLQNGNAWTDTHRNLGVLNYAFVIFVRRVIDPRI